MVIPDWRLAILDLIAPKRPAICLTMIVRNEAHIIHELIAAVAPHIDSWVIVDTGSTDGFDILPVS